MRTSGKKAARDKNGAAAADLRISFGPEFR
jgi:hypothetical protein